MTTGRRRRRGRIKRARESLRKRVPFLFWNNYIRLPRSDRTLSDLVGVNYKYERMFGIHEKLHERLIASLDAERNRNVLEIACGAGFTIPHFRKKQLQYFGWDISETALSVAMLKYPEEKYFNLSVTDLDLVKDGSFDIVYNSSMLEHIGFYEDAIREMVRVAKHEVYIMFFEGLIEGSEIETQFFPFSEEEISGSRKIPYGRKLVMQDHRVHEQKGFFVHRFGRDWVSSFADTLGHEFRILDRSNADYIDEQAVLVIEKTDR